MNIQTESQKDSYVDSSSRPTGVIIAALLAACLPLVMSTPLATEILIWTIFGLGFNLLLGFTGVLSFGHAAYFGLGAYSAGLAFRYWNADIWVGLGLGVLAPVLLACFIGMIAIKKRGVYFAMISLAFGQMLYFLALSPLKDITRGEDGLTQIPVQTVFSISLGKPFPLYCFVVIVTTLMLFLTWRILQSPFGKLLQAYRENEERAKACGFNTTLVKFVSLVISAFYAGLAGALNTVFLGYVPVSALFWLTSGTIVMITILGGKGTLLGPLVGASVFLFLQNTISILTPRWELFVGGIFVAIILLFPGGIVGTIEEKVSSYRAMRLKG